MTDYDDLLTCVDCRRTDETVSATSEWAGDDPICYHCAVTRVRDERSAVALEALRAPTAGPGTCACCGNHSPVLIGADVTGCGEALCTPCYVSQDIDP